MAVYTHISGDDLARHLAGFRLGEAVAFEGIGDGVENTNYKLTTGTGLYILTLFEGRVAEKDLPFFLSFMEHLRGAGVPVAAVVPDAQGHAVLPLAGKPSVITTFLPGAWPKETTPEHCRAVGETLARMHLAAADFGGARENGMGLSEWRRLIMASGAAEEKLRNFLHDELSFLEKNTPKNLPRGAVHADLFPDNVFFEGKKLSGVIDFYFACTDFFAYDLMLTLNAWCFDGAGGLQREKSDALLAGYARHRQLTPDEEAALPIFGRAAALRIVATRLYDALHLRPDAVVTPKDPQEHVQILRFYQNDMQRREPKARWIPGPAVP